MRFGCISRLGVANKLAPRQPPKSKSDHYSLLMPSPNSLLDPYSSTFGLGSLRLVTLSRVRERVVASSRATGRGCLEVVVFHFVAKPPILRCTHEILTINRHRFMVRIIHEKSLSRRKNGLSSTVLRACSKLYANNWCELAHWHECTR